MQSTLDSVRFVGVEWARQLTNLPLAFVGQIVSIVMLPHLSSILHGRGQSAHRQTVEVTVEMLCLVTIPVVCATFVLAPELMALVFIPPHWGDAEFTLFSQGALAVRMISIGLLFMILENILLPGLFSIQSMWWPVLWGLAASAFQLLWLLGFANAGLGAQSPVLLAGVAFAYPVSRIFKNGILFLVLRHKTGMFPGLTFFWMLGRMALLVGGTLAVTFAVRLLCDRIIGPIPTDAEMVPYKVTVFLRLVVPSAAMGIAFLGFVLAVGYRKQLLELKDELLHRGHSEAVD